ncbi:MAG TPA: calcineurin-like phosphoesterase C-terminal domain-containing protein [Phycisphaerae bacterium]|nr:calcineurin-like phosphoesterase C-terminal domain-containing protein [Phycisphaerae bacterium]
MRTEPILLAAACVLVFGIAPQSRAVAEHPTGVVFHDRNANGVRDADENGIPGVAVSNQREVVVTDAEGRWRLPAADDAIFFVIKPSHWMTPVNAYQLPTFYHIHKPAGSPSLRYPGVPPTGPLPPSIDFPLIRRPEPEQFRVIVASDPQCRNEQELEFLVRDNLEELVGTDAVFGITLGDIVDNVLSLYEKHNACFARVGIPWYNVIGNHDTNQDASRDEDSDETFERVFGPSYYAFEFGRVHFVILDNIHYRGRPDSKTSSYFGGIGDKQLEFLRNDLALVPQDRLVVVLMHIPIMDVKDRESLYRILETRRHCVSFSGHTHTQRHCFLGPDEGWMGESPHHHMVSTVMSGSHFGGAFDELGIPHATMADGAPNGYSIITFHGNQYAIRFKASRRPADYQMNIFMPFEVDAGQDAETEVVVNVFGGSPRSRVEMRVGDVSWTPMQHEEREDPAYRALIDAAQARAGAGDRPMQKSKPSPHIWVGRLPRGLTPGAHSLDVRTQDSFGQVFESHRIFVIR